MDVCYPVPEKTVHGPPSVHTHVRACASTVAVHRSIKCVHQTCKYIKLSCYLRMLVLRHRYLYASQQKNQLIDIFYLYHFSHSCAQHCQGFTKVLCGWFLVRQLYSINNILLGTYILAEYTHKHIQTKVSICSCMHMSYCRFYMAWITKLHKCRPGYPLIARTEPIVVYSCSQVFDKTYLTTNQYNYIVATTTATNLNWFY